MFSRHLHVLERTAPTTVRAANRMRGPSLATQSPYRPVPRGQIGVRAPGLRGPGMRGPGMRGPGITTGQARYGAPSAAAMRRRESQKRRRDILFLLAGSAGATLLLGAIPGIHKVLYLNLVLDILLAAYVGLLVRMRNIAAERNAKLVWLPRVQPAPSGAVRRGTGRYASPGSSVDYRDLSFRHAAAN